MSDSQVIKASFITDENGVKKSVVLPLDVYDQLLEDLHDLSIVAERREEGTISHDDAINDLKRHGY